MGTPNDNSPLRPNEGIGANSDWDYDAWKQPSGPQEFDWTIGPASLAIATITAGLCAAAIAVVFQSATRGEFDFDFQGPLCGAIAPFLAWATAISIAGFVFCADSRPRGVAVDRGFEVVGNQRMSAPDQTKPATDASRFSKRSVAIALFVLTILPGCVQCAACVWHDLFEPLRATLAVVALATAGLVLAVMDGYRLRDLVGGPLSALSGGVCLGLVIPFAMGMGWAAIAMTVVGVPLVGLSQWTAWRLAKLHSQITPTQDDSP